MTAKGKGNYTPAQMIAAIKASHGLITIAAESLGTSRQTVFNYIRRFPTVKSALEDARERILDVAEAKLFSKIASGDPVSIHFTLRTLGKKRGYVEKSEIDANVNGNFKVSVYIPDNGR